MDLLMDSFYIIIHFQNPIFGNNYHNFYICKVYHIQLLELSMGVNLQYHAIQGVVIYFQQLFNKPRDSFLKDLQLDSFFLIIHFRNCAFRCNYHNFYICMVYHIQLLELSMGVNLQFHAIQGVVIYFQQLFNKPRDSFLKD